MDTCEDDDDVNTPPVSFGGPGSEGLYYEYNFEAGYKHLLKGFIKSNLEVDKISIVLANNLPQQTHPNFAPPCGEPGRSYGTIPIDNDMQVVFEMSNFEQTTWIPIEIEIFSDEDFNQLLFTLEDDDVHANDVQNVNDAPIFFIGGLSIECCEVDKAYHSTEKIIFAGSSSTQHDPLPVLTHVKNKITALADNGDIIIRDDEDVTFRAGNQIDISTTGTNAFIIEPEGNFTAEIEDCFCSSEGSNICLNYIPPGTPPGENVGGFEYIFVPNVFDPSGTAGPENSFFSVFYGNQYPMPYNAHRAIFRIFEEGGGLFHEQIINDPCNGIEPGILSWDGCVGDLAAASAVYTWTLELENCHAKTNPILAGDVTLVNSNPNCSTGLNLTTTDRNQNQQLDNKKITNEYFIAYPNPVQNDINIEYILSSETSISLFLQNDDGKTNYFFEKEVIKKAGKYQLNYNMDNYQKGIYYLILKTEKNIFHQKLIKI